MATTSFEDFHEVPNLNFNITKLREELDRILKTKKFNSPGVTHFGAISINQIPNDESSIQGSNIRGRYWTIADDTGKEVSRDIDIDESKYTQLVPEFEKTYFKEVYETLSKRFKLSHFIHVSALGINLATDSKYAESKLEGEKKIQGNFPLTTILRPSIVYSVDDNFTTNFMTLLNRLPLFPLYYKGKTKFMPIHCSDLTDVIFHVIKNNINSNIIECVGPETLTFREILEKLLTLIGKKRFLIPFPLFLANFSASVFELLPRPLLTKDQLRLLKYDNISSGKYKTNFDIGVPSKSYFENEVKKYCYMWREGGQFSTDKYIKNIDNKTS